MKGISKILSDVLPFLAMAIMFATYKAFSPGALALTVLPAWGAVAAGLAVGLLSYGTIAYVVNRMQRKTSPDHSPDQAPLTPAHQLQATRSANAPEQQQAKSHNSARFTDMIMRQRAADQNHER